MSATTEAALSVILPAKSCATIEATLEHLRAQTVRGRVELVVVTESEARVAGFGRIEPGPFFVPQTVALPRPAVAVARALERSGPLARLAFHFRFIHLVAASCQDGEWRPSGV